MTELKQKENSKYGNLADEPEDNSISRDTGLRSSGFNQDESPAHLRNQASRNYEAPSKFQPWYEKSLIFGLALNLFLIFADFSDIFHLGSLKKILFHMFLCTWDLLQIFSVYEGMKKGNAQKVRRGARSMQVYLVIYSAWNFHLCYYGYNAMITSLDYSFRQIFGNLWTRGTLHGPLLTPNQIDLHCYSSSCVWIIAAITTAISFIFYYLAFLHGALRWNKSPKRGAISESESESFARDKL